MISTSVILIFVLILNVYYAIDGFKLNQNAKNFNKNIIKNSIMVQYMAGFAKSSNKDNEVVSSGQCLCGSGLSYQECCKPYHDGSSDITIPAKLVRARFAALALGKVDYVLKTTDATHKDFIPEEKRSKYTQWERDVQKYTQDYKFISLHFDNEKDLETIPSEDIAYVSFIAKLKKGNRKMEDLTELSKFVKNSDGKWLYAGIIDSIILHNIR